ncbi:MAG: hypothetical protein EAY75_10140 [Bacteroidetes bacterium]|nr:MAG: hypothetical protein EAY75_10140 [Bacteroidota bacterium]
MPHQHAQPQHTPFFSRRIRLMLLLVLALPLALLIASRWFWLPANPPAAPVQVASLGFTPTHAIVLAGNSKLATVLLLA